nr:hypothetical protein CFP56_07572 [Quercus suber]
MRLGKRDPMLMRKHDAVAYYDQIDKADGSRICASAAIVVGGVLGSVCKELTSGQVEGGRTRGPFTDEP